VVYTEEANQQIVESEIVAAARKIYNTYYNLHGPTTRNPIGVALDEKTYRGQLLFTKAPILLPGERFIPVNQLEAKA
jgi:hypothetical protein